MKKSLSKFFKKTGPTSSLLEQAWEQREEQIYPKLFGPSSRGIFVLDPKMIEQAVGKSTPYDIRWHNYGVLEYGPTKDSPLKVMMVCAPIIAPKNIKLVSRKVRLMQITGITFNERDIAQNTSSKGLTATIIKNFRNLAINPHREPLY